MQLRPRRRTESGFSLAEMLITVVILGVITVPLADVVISALKNTTTTSDRLDLSHDAQLSSSYFAKDVAAVGLRDYDNTSGGSLPFKQSVQVNAVPYDEDGLVCGTATTPDAAIRLFSDRWDTSVSPAEQRTDVVAYYVKNSELHRIKCAGPSTAPQSDVVIAHNVKADSVTVSCSSTCESATVPQEITLRLIATKPTTGDYAITLDGQRRQS